MFKRHHFHRPSSGPSALGVGLVAAAAAAGLTYFLYGTEKGAAKREKIKGYVSDIKDKTTKTVGELSDLGKEIAGDMADMVKEKYETISKLSKDELADMADKVREHWNEAKEKIGEILDEGSEVDKS